MGLEKKGKFVRISPDVEVLIKHLKVKKNISEGSVIDEAIRLLAKKEKVTS